MVKKERIIYILIIISLILFIIFTLNHFNSLRRSETIPSKVPYTVSWTYKEGEVIEFQKDDLVFDENWKQIEASNVEVNTYFYNLSPGRYYLLTRSTSNDSSSFDIITIIIE